MILGTGVDLVDVRRIEKSVGRFGGRFVARILTDGELRPSLEGARLAAYVARQFAAKEAVSKALGTGMRQGVHFRNIIVSRNEAGAPVVELQESAARVAAALGVTDIHLSLSDEKEYALAYALAVSQ